MSDIVSSDENSSKIIVVEQETLPRSQKSPDT